MKYKVKYKDSNHHEHVRYYTALNSTTAREMFNATVSHSLKDQVEDVEVLKLDEDNRCWTPTKTKK